MIQFSDVVGFGGTGLIVGAYLLLQLKRMSSDSLSFSILNGLGALLIIYSLIYKFNFAAFLVEAFWLAISVFGVIRYLLKHTGKPPASEA